MATVNSASLRNGFEACKADIDSLRKEGEITEKVDKAITDLCDMMAVMIAVFLKKNVTAHPFMQPVHVP